MKNKSKLDQQRLFVNRLQEARAEVPVHFDRRTDERVSATIEIAVWLFPFTSDLGELGVLAVHSPRIDRPRRGLRQKS